MALKKGIKALLAEAGSQVKSYGAEELIKLRAEGGVALIDVRDQAELARDGIIPGAAHVPRGMLEFCVDPDSPWYSGIFGQDKEYVFFCAIGWRSLLAAKSVQDMGLGRVAHLEGGYAAWLAAGGPVAELGEEK